ncbi:MAG TPA: sigma 54-interacting transcriptional regulator [Polyangia bacterium]|nr:sigma 54-interacting transcriptional regulator [Polyangia bacterium]
MAAANVVDGSAEQREARLPARYRVGERLGAGASGETFAALDTATGDACVIKLFAADPRARGFALAEFRGLETLAHPSVVRLRYIGRLSDGRLYLVTDRVAGPGLEALATIPDEESRRTAFARAALDLASALAHLHARGILHGDVTPANVRISSADPEAPRAVLIDFGLAGPPRVADGAARGTLGYAAPEALTGARTAAADLFALGATLYEAWSGAPPFGRGLRAAERMLAGPAPPLSAVRPGLGEGWDALCARLLAADPADRPASARLVLREVTRLAAGAATPTEIDLEVPYGDGDPLAGIFVGRKGERAALRAALERLAEGAATTSALALVGAPGAGRRTLFEAVARDLAVAAAAGALPALEIWRGDVAALEGFVGALPGAKEEDARRAVEARMAALAEALEARGRERPLCLFLDEGAAAEALAAFVAGAAPGGRTLVIVPTRAPLARPFADAIALPPFGASEIRELVAAGAAEEEPAPAAIAAVAESSRGNPALAALLARRLVASLRRGEAWRPDESSGDLETLLAGAFAAFAPDTRRLLLAIALVGDGALEAAALDESAAADALAAARNAGWIDSASAGGLRLPGPAHRRVVLRDAPLPAAAEVARRALAALPGGDARRVDALVLAGRPEEAARILRDDAAAAASTGDHARAAGLLGQASLLAPGALTFGEQLALATGLGALGRYEEAARALGEARARAAGPAEVAAGCEREAWLLARRGDLAGAREALTRGLAESEAAGLPTAALRARLGRLLVTAGRFTEALATVEPTLAAGQGTGTPGEAVAALALETALLASAYLGDLARARRHLGELSGGASETRRAYLAGLLAQLAGDEAAARDAYRSAYELAAGSNDVHTVAAVALNLGGLLIEEGLYGEALTASARAVRELGRLGASAELVPALVNAANLFVELGDLPAARRALDRAHAVLDKGRPSAALATAAFVEGDLARRGGEIDAAVRHYRRSAAAFREVSQPAGAESALLAQVEALAAAGRPGEARRALDEALAGRAAGGASGAAAEAPDLARAQGALALADGAGVDLTALAATLERLARAAHARARRPSAWRLAALAGRLAARAGDGVASRAAFDFARSIWKEVRMATPEHHRPGWQSDPDAVWLAEAGVAAPGGGPNASRAQAAESRLRRLLRINKRLNSELRLPRLLEMVLDTVIELTDAERGFLLLEDESGELVIKAARNIDQRTLETEELALSRSIARQAAAGGEPVVTIDAAGDDRFREALSVSDLHLRSVLAVPLAIKGHVAGTIYVDHRLRKGAFDQEDVRLVLDFAEQAAIALENARLLGELRRRERQVEALNRRLEAELAARREEISGIKVELRENREALAVRYDYRNIIGRTPRMMELFRLIDRITDTALPVVIQGESGTGKELVARALHANGPRRERPFVGENCAAIPETLLESTLFGYVRGAFTGAEHDTRGLFEIADGGTLFLDEVGEMSPAMQGKLLRVLQEAEIRRVGSERTRKVDVRIIAATNRDLGRMVEEGKFRRDLFFRLNVAAVALPPLRDRRDDIPLMVDHFLEKLARRDGRPASKPIEPGAVARLCAYRWPGNVRELENEVTRAEALSGARITAADLSPRVGAAEDAGVIAAEDHDNLVLKPRVERLERSLLREALGRAGNNQTKAAELLGLSRFGLQKKLKRYNFVL